MPPTDRELIKALRDIASSLDSILKELRDIRRERQQGR